MNKEVMVIELQAVKALTVYAMVVLLGGLFMSSIVEGLRQHLAANTGGATLLYFMGLASLTASIYVFKKGKQIISIDK